MCQSGATFRDVDCCFSEQALKKMTLGYLVYRIADKQQIPIL